MRRKWGFAGEAPPNQRGGVCGRRTLISHLHQPHPHVGNRFNAGNTKLTHLNPYLLHTGQIDELAASKGLVIAGYYAANENLRDNTFEKAHHKISEKISMNCNPSFLVVVGLIMLHTLDT